MAATEPWQTAEISGPKKASVIPKPEVVVAMLKKAKHPILVVGYKAAEIDLEDRKLIDFIVEFAKKTKIPVVGTAHIVGEFLRRGYSPAGFMPAVDIGNRLADAEWSGIDGKGAHDVALFVGLPYYMELTILSGLKHFAPQLRTMTLDNVYHSHASWSFPNMSTKEWLENLKVIIEKSEAGGTQENVDV
jgi:acetyl-CoA decarbonylase/synthase complex subunit epsilon